MLRPSLGQIATWKWVRKRDGFRHLPTAQHIVTMAEQAMERIQRQIAEDAEMREKAGKPETGQLFFYVGA